jgi:hypothetical protein
MPLSHEVQHVIDSLEAHLVAAGKAIKSLEALLVSLKASSTASAEGAATGTIGAEQSEPVGGEGGGVLGQSGT